MTHRQVRLRHRPKGLPVDGDFEVVSVATPDLARGQFLVEVLYVSVDPAMRTWISGEPTYRDPVNPGDLVPAMAVGRIVASAHAEFAAGEHVRGVFGVQEFALSDGTGVARIDPGLAPLPAYLGMLGISGLSAYFGLLRTGRARAGDTVLVSGAAGAVGGLVGQIARIQGCRVIGVAGGEAKCAYLVDRLGFDAAIDYQRGETARQIASLCPRGIDVYFDNVGGAVLEAALDNLATGARIVVCGAVSQYNTAVRHGPANYLALLVKRASMHGFLVFDHLAEFAAASADLSQWHAEGRLHGDVHVMEGLTAFPAALRGLFEGINLGKLVLRLNPSSQDFS